MSSYRDEDVQVLHDQSRDENFEDIDSGSGEVKGRNENVRIADVPSDIDEGELLDICFMYSIAPEYKFIRPSGNMRVIEPLDEDSIMIEFEVPNRWSNDPLRHLLASLTPYDRICVDLIKARGLAAVNLRSVIAVGMAPKKTKSSKMAKVAEAMKKQAAADSLGKEVPPTVPNPQPTKTEAILGGSHSKPTHLSPTTEPYWKGRREESILGPPPMPPRAGEALDI
ncbi:hypothetical protein JCGZ_27123 [Jatropha curcas]|uniref:Uncharacterized protein n=1 Tax=Jatropha curcas TaxID=180498 RepID=A0A067JWB7_JATCU|nr:hypothetical protein JCGZ_27123 [Jatropha curcas]